MRKLFLVCALAIVGFGQVLAQDFERGIFNHLGANISAGTEGIGVGIAAPCTEYLEFGFGINFFPTVKVKADDDLSKWVDRLKVYPVLKFTLTGRLF